MLKRAATVVTMVACVLSLSPSASAAFKVFGAAAYIAPLSDTDIQSIGNAIEASDELGWNAGFEFRGGRFGLEIDAAWADSDIESSAGTFGSVTFQPIAANLNFHIFSNMVFDLYLGAGFAYTNFDDIDLSTGGSATTEADSSWDVQVGLDINIGDHFAVILGVRYYDLTLESSGTEFAVDPLVTRVGLAFRF